MMTKVLTVTAAFLVGSSSAFPLRLGDNAGVEHFIRSNPVHRQLRELGAPGRESQASMAKSASNCATACQFAGWRTGEVKGTAPFCNASPNDCRNRDGVMEKWDAGNGCWSGQKVCCCNK